MNDRCLTDEEITAYVDGVAESSLRKRIERHLSECGLCLHNVAELKKLVSANGAEEILPTRAAIEMAESIITDHTQSPDRLDITAIIRNGICRIMETTGSLLPPRPPSRVTVRGDRRIVLNPRIAKSVAGYLITIELTPKKDMLEPRLTIIEESSSLKPDGVKAKLYSPGTCETKYSRNGRMTFSALGQGFFRIEIEEIGRISLEIQ
jgi:hypothetical protein